MWYQTDPRSRNRLSFSNLSLDSEGWFDWWVWNCCLLATFPTGFMGQNRPRTCESRLDLYDTGTVIYWFVDKASIHSLMTWEMNRYFEWHGKWESWWVGFRPKTLSWQVKIFGVKEAGSIHAKILVNIKSFLMRPFIKIRMVFGRSLFSEPDHEFTGIDR